MRRVVAPSAFLFIMAGTVNRNTCVYVGVLNLYYNVLVLCNCQKEKHCRDIMRYYPQF